MLPPRRPLKVHQSSYGVVRNVARRFETRPAHPAGPLPEEIDANEESQSRLFDRTWARAVMEEAARLQRARAADRGPEALRRVELLRLRFEEGLPIRAIADRWGVDPAALHHTYALARKEFRAALLEVVAFHHPGNPADLEREAAGLLAALS
jgi:RNA polymerase sigma-70 factor (ECF subfamily)